MTLQNLTDQTSNTGALVKTTNVFLSLFVVSTLISQTAMDFFSALFVLGVLILGATQPAYRAWVLRRTGLEWFVGLWFLATLVSLVLGMNLVPIPQWTKLLDFRWLVIALLVGRHLSFHGLRESSFTFQYLMFGVACLWAIAIFFLKYDPLQPGATLDQIGGGTVRTGGFLQQPIVFAQLYGLWLMIPLGLFAADLPLLKSLRTRPSPALVWTAATLLGAAALLLSFTRGIWLAVPIAALVVLGARRWTWAVGALIAGALSVWGLMQIWPTLNARVLQAFQGGDSERLLIWSANWEIWKSSPWFGVGYNHNVQLLPEYLLKIGAPEGTIISHAHNQLLQILAGMGVFGLLAYSLFWAVALFFAFRTYRRLPANDFFHRGLALGVIGAICVFLFGGAFESNFEHAKIRLVLALVLGLFVYLQDIANSKRN